MKKFIVSLVFILGITFSAQANYVVEPAVSSYSQFENELQLENPDCIVYVSPATYTVFLGFVTMRYTVFYCNGTRSVEGGTWWCGCSEWGANE